jgi:hypothetical protein
MSEKMLQHEDYTVGWTCPLEVEQIAALEMLDEEHKRLPQQPADRNVYTLGSTHSGPLGGAHSGRGILTGRQDGGIYIGREHSQALGASRTSCTGHGEDGNGDPAAVQVSALQDPGATIRYLE